MPGTVVPAFNLSTRENLCEFEANLVYKTSSKTVRNTDCFKNQRQRREVQTLNLSRVVGVRLF